MTMSANLTRRSQQDGYAGQDMRDLYTKIRKAIVAIKDAELENLKAGLHHLQGKIKHFPIRSEVYDRRDDRLLELNDLLMSALPAGIAAGFSGEIVWGWLEKLRTSVEKMAYWDESYKGDINDDSWASCHFRELRGQVCADLEPLKTMAFVALPPSRPCRPPVSPIVIDGQRVQVNGRFISLNVTEERLEDILHFLNQLIANLGNWVSGPDISKAAPNRYDERFRWDRLQRSLPPIIQKHIQTDRRKGKRLKPLP
jgi:hypothetical protein